MGLEGKFRKIALGLGLAAATSLAVAGGLPRDIGKSSGVSPISNYLETDSLYNTPSTETSRIPGRISKGEMSRSKWLEERADILPFNISFYSFKNMRKGARKKFDLGYKEVSFRIPIDGKDSPFYVGGVRFTIFNQTKSPDQDYGFLVGVGFKF